MKNKNFKKGGQGVGWCVYLRWSGDYIKNTNFTSEIGTRVSYHGIFGRNQYSGTLPPPFVPLFVPPACPPFHIRAIRIENAEFSTFLSSKSLFIPFRPTFCKFEKSKRSYKFCIYNFSSKCFVLSAHTQFLKTYYDKSDPFKIC